MLASRCVAALDTAVKKKPDDGDGNSEIEDLPPAMKLKVLSILGKEMLFITNRIDLHMRPSLEKYLLG